MWNTIVVIVLVAMIFGIGLNLLSLIRKYRYNEKNRIDLMIGIVISVMAILALGYGVFNALINTPY